MRIFCLFWLILTLLISTQSNAQQVNNIIVTDVKGTTHNLYEDYLDKGKTVMIELFFTSCPPCRSLAPQVETLYQKWGASQGEVQFFKLTTQSFDNDARVLQFDNDYGITFPSISTEGGSISAISQFLDGSFGQFLGTPNFIVIAPDRSVQYDVSFSKLDETISDVVDSVIETAPDTPVEISLFDHNNNTPLAISSIAKVYLKSKSNSTLSYNLGELTNNSFSFEYPIANIGDIPDPYIELESIADPGEGLSALDLIVLQKHVLGIEPILDPYKVIAADINNNGSTSALDIIELVKVTLGVQPQFNNNSTHLFFNNDCPSCMNTFPINPIPGETLQLNIRAVTVGDLD